MPSDGVLLEAGMVLEVDCSKPLEDPDREKLRPMSEQEARLAADDAAAAELEATARAWQQLRQTRDALLAATDYAKDDPPWAAWRKILFDLPELTADPAYPEWPEPPAVKSTLYPFHGLWPELDWSPILKGS